jgi:hypothetical protein
MYVATGQEAPPDQCISTVAIIGAKPPPTMPDTWKLKDCFWQLHLAHFGGLIWPTLSH